MTTTYQIRKTLTVSTRKGDGVTTYLKAIISVDGQDRAVSLRADEIAAYDRDTVTVTDTYLARRAESDDLAATIRGAAESEGEQAREALLVEHDRDAVARGLSDAYRAEIAGLIRSLPASRCADWHGGMIDAKTRRAVLTMRARHGI